VRVLVLNKFWLPSVRYSRWAPPGTELVLLTSSASIGSPADLVDYTDHMAFDSYIQNAQVEYYAHRLQAKHAFDRVLAMSEYDLIRAARLREAWSLPGQNLHSALAYRDKLLMKQCLLDAAVPIASFAAIDDPTQLIDFCAMTGYPVVVKPRCAASSVGVRVLRDEQELYAFLGPNTPLSGDRPGNLLAEGYVSNTLFHVDGVVADGEVIVCWPSQTTSGLDFLQGETLVSTMLEPGDPALSALKGVVVRALQALPTPPVSLFHAEVFGMEDGALVLNEIGCRIGGGKIRDVMRLAFGFDSIEWYARTVMEDETINGYLPKTPTRQAGYAKVPVRPGIVRAIPQRCMVSGIDVFEVKVRLGQQVHAPASLDDCLSVFATARPTRAEVHESLTGAVRWFNQAVRIDNNQRGG